MSEMTTPALTSKQLTRTNRQLEADSKTMFGFWVYLMTDCVLFASLFATFVVLRNNTFGGPAGTQLFDLKFVMAETVILLTSSYTCGLGILASHQRAKSETLFWFLLTFALGAAFLGLELSEFHKLALEGNSWRRSGFLSGYFTLVATHGLHITIGLLWMATAMARVARRGITRFTARQLAMLSYFWHFLDIIWIFIFTVVYLVGKL